MLDISGAKFHFKKPSLKFIEAFQAKIAEKKNVMGDIFPYLIKVEGIQNEDGKEIDLEEVKTLELPFDVVTQIFNAWVQEVKKLTGGETDPNAEIQPTN